MRFLFVLNNGFYLRNYGAVIRSLAADGHDVDVAFSLPRPGDDDLFAAAFHGAPHIALHEAPRRTGWWWAVADPVRAIRDYIHYLQPAFDATPRLVARGSERVPGFVRKLVGGRGGPGWRRRLFDRLCRTTERALPADRGLTDWLAERAPDAVLFSPLVELGYEQVHVLKAARQLAIPTGHLVASWDNLSNKGRIQIPTDLCIVWNDYQRQEAIDLHGCAADRVVATGAQLYDDWFERRPARDRPAFCDALGLDPGRPILLYACSAPFICESEVGLVERWLKHLRSAGQPRLREAQIVIRPHPANARQWHNVDMSALGPVVIAPRNGTATISEEDRQFYFDSLTHAAAVVGINTSVFLEAGIAGTRCFTLTVPELAPSQTGTLHFRYLVEGGLLETATTIEAHHAGLADAIEGDGLGEGARAFVQRFLRPHGADRSAVPIARAAIERLTRERPRAERPPAWAPLFRALLWPVAALYVRPRYLARRKQRPAAGAPAEPQSPPPQPSQPSQPLHRSEA